MKIGQRILNQRNKQKMSRRELFEESGVSESAIKQYEGGLRQPQIAQLQKIAIALKIPLVELLDVGDSISEKHGTQIELQTEDIEHKLSLMTSENCESFLFAINQALGAALGSNEKEQTSNVRHFVELCQTYRRMILRDADPNPEPKEEPQ